MAVGLRRREAQARCPSVELFERDDGRDARAFEPVLAALEDIAPRIEVSESGRCAVPTVGPSRYHGGDRALAAMVLDRLSVVAGCPVGIGIADGPSAAGLVAEEAVSVTAVVSPWWSLRGRPRCSWPSCRCHAWPMSALLSGQVARNQATADLVDVLRRLGLRTFGRFAALPTPDVSARFGPIGLAAHRLANGWEERPPNVDRSAAGPAGLGGPRPSG